MLSFALVLLVASSAFAAPSVSVSQYGINEIAPVPDNGRLVSSYLTDRSFEILDGGETTVYTMTVQQIVNDLANQNDAASQALAVSQTIAFLGEVVTGRTGDPCEFAAVANAVASGNAGAIKQAVGNFIGRLQTSIDLIVQSANNPNSLRYVSGPREKCAAEGRAYQFEAAWDAVLNAASPYTLPLVNEEYCAAKRLYSSFNSRSNNVAAAVTAAAVPQVVSVIQRALTPAANFLRAVASGGNPAQAAAILKSALVQAASA
ncbi:fibroin light chain-like [Cydia strobilella]|uniref:fibroin light chain-like n=1 Tax=Cydia strobilella TaxID=1100964 RepID=UPI0030054F6E